MNKEKLYGYIQCYSGTKISNEQDQLGKATKHLFHLASPEPLQDTIKSSLPQPEVGEEWKA